MVTPPPHYIAQNSFIVNLVRAKSYILIKALKFSKIIADGKLSLTNLCGNTDFVIFNTTGQKINSRYPKFR